MPGANVVVPSPEELRLEFTQVPRELMWVRLMAGEQRHETGPVLQDPEDGRVFAVPIGDTLGAGHYTILWRVVGQDGHVVRGDIPFSVAVQ